MRPVKAVPLKKNRGWRARIRVEGKRIFLGYFDTPESAALAYDIAARTYHKEYGRYNFPLKGEQSARRVPNDNDD